MLSQQRNCSVQLLLCDRICAGQNDRRGRFDLIIVEFAKVFHIYLDFSRIHHCNGITQRHLVIGHFIHSSDHIGKLTHAGRLNYDPVRIIFCDHLSQCLAEITHQAAANAAGIHLRNMDACILQKATVNTDLTKFIFDQYQFLSTIAFGDHFLDQRGFTGTEKPGINIDLCHKLYTFCPNFYALYYNTISQFRQV